jgi:Tol biopolymer transport system component
MRRTTAPLFSIILAAIAAALATSILIVVLFAASLEPAHAAFPGEDGKIAFQSDRDGNNEIYTMNANGTGVQRLTNNSARDEDPAYSPDGKNIAFQSDRDGGFFEIYRMSSTGTSQTRLTFNAADDVRPSWQPLP